MLHCADRIKDQLHVDQRTSATSDHEALSAALKLIPHFARKSCQAKLCSVLPQQQESMQKEQVFVLLRRI